MANTIKTDINRIENNDNDTVLRNVTDTFLESFTASTGCNKFTLQANSTYKTIDFGQVATSVMVFLTSEETIKVRMNGGSEEFETKGIYWAGNLTQIDVKNETDNDSEINYEVYGS
jgi:hypothetical protein